jgi:hypothetical protein
MADSAKKRKRAEMSSSYSDKQQGEGASSEHGDSESESHHAETSSSHSDEQQSEGASSEPGDSESELHHSEQQGMYVYVSMMCGELQ